MYDAARHTLVVWQRDGTFLYNATVEHPSTVRNVEGLRNGRFLVSGISIIPAGDRLEASFTAVTIAGPDARASAIELRARPPAVVLHGRRSYPLRGVEVPTPEVLVRPDGNLYLVPADTYAVHAMTSLGDPLWQIRVDAPTEFIGEYRRRCY